MGANNHPTVVPANATTDESNSADIIREYVNAKLAEDATFHDEDEAVVHVDGEAVTRADVDAALTEVLE
jgi:hypothetical protein